MKYACFAKGTVKRMARSRRNECKHVQQGTCIQNSLNSIVNSQAAQFQLGKILDYVLNQRYTNMKGAQDRWSASLSIRDMWIRATGRHTTHSLERQKQY